MLLSQLKEVVDEALEKTGDAEVFYSGEHQTQHGDIDGLISFHSQESGKDKSCGYHLMDNFSHNELQAGGGEIKD